MRANVALLTATLISIILFSGVAYPFWGMTHRNISEAAYISAQIDEILLQQFSIKGNSLLTRSVPFSGGTMTAIGWLRKGSIGEDSGLRPVHHFYDPVYNRGLTVPGMALGEKAFEWALEDPAEVIGQDYSYRHAKEAYRQALTKADAKNREHWLATTFYILGHVLHMLQDMASPGHTRNAMHIGQIGVFDFGPKSVVETHLEGIRSDLVFDGYTIPRDSFSRIRDLWAEMDASGLPMQGPSARGLSQVINRNFVSEGTNFTAFQAGNHAVEYPFPVLDTSRCNDETVTTTNADGDTIQGLVTFCANSFVDPVTGVLETNPRMTTYSLLGRDAAAKGINGAGIFTLNALNAVEIGRLAIPRAVGYSAALLEYFFRGKLEFDVRPDPSNVAQLELTFSNRSAEAMTGTFTLYTEDKSGKRIPVPGASVTGVTLAGVPTANPGAPGIDPGLPGLVPDVPGGSPSGPIIGSTPASQDYRLTFTPDPNVKIGSLTLVFVGTLGNEQNAVVGKMRPREPSLFVIQEVAEFLDVERQDYSSGEGGPGEYWCAGSLVVTKDPGRQRARGHFSASEAVTPGTYIKSISLLPVANGQAPSEIPGVSLRVNDLTIGQVWSRESNPGMIPKSWEIVLNQPATNMEVPSLPSTLFIETVGGRMISTPLVWWKHVEARSDASAELHCCGGWGPCYSWYSGWVSRGMREEVGVSVYLGGNTSGQYPYSSSITSSGFMPLQGIAGHAVGVSTYEQEGEFADICTTKQGDFVNSRSVQEFVTIDSGSNPPVTLWLESEARVIRNTTSREYLFPLGDLPVCPSIAPPPGLPTLRYKRVYRPGEQLWNALHGEAAPEYIVEFR
jgi:hypothetical protein